MQKSVWFLFCLTLVAVLPAVAVGSTDEVIWGEEIRLSFNTAHDYTDSANQRNIAVDRSGNIHVVWTNAANYRTIYKRYTPGAGWGDSTMLGTDIPGTHYDRYPALCVDDSGRVHIVWASGPATSANAAIYYQMWDPSLGWNATSRRLSDDSVAKPKTNPQVATTPDGHVHVVWGERSSTTKYEYYLVYVEKIDGVWQPQVKLELSDFERISVGIAGSADNRVHLVWRGSDQANPTYSQIFYKERIGTVWQPVVRITNGLTTHQTQPAICVNPLTRQPHIVWRSLVVPNGRICHTYRAGGVWQATDTVSERSLTTVQAEPQLAAAADGRLYVVWSGYSAASTGYLQVRMCERTPEGIWRTPKDVTTGSYAKYATCLAMDTLNELHLVWRDLRNGTTNSDVYYRSGFNPARDVAVLAILAPAGTYMRGSGAIVPQAWVKNFGIARHDSFPVVMTVGEAYKDTFWVRNLGSGESTLVSFAAWMPASGVYAVKCSTLLDGDRDNTNDSKTGLTLVADFVEQFEADNARYEPTPSSAAWAWGVPASPRPAARSGTRVWGAPLTGSYTNNADWRLISVPYVAYVDTPVVSFWHWYNLEAGYDGGNLSYSTDNGASWSVVSPWTRFAAPYAGIIRGLGYENGYSGVSAGWEQAFFRLPVNSGTVVRLRWRLGSDASNTSSGWMIDDVILLGLAKLDVGLVALPLPAGTLVRDTIVPQAWVKNYGSALPTASFTITMTIPSASYVSTVPVGPLAIGESVLVSFAKWYPPAVGFYAVKCSTRLVGDIYPLNDVLQAEAAVVNFAQTFTENNGGYTPVPATGAWAWGIPAAPRKPALSMPNVWGAPLSGSYANSANWRLLSVPYAALADTPAISFWHWRRFYSAADGGNLSYSIDNGATWTVLEPWPGRSEPYYASAIAGLGGERGYTGLDTNWTQTWFRIPVAAGKAFWLRWRLGSDAASVSYGWMIDDVAGMNVGLAQDAGVVALTMPVGTLVLDSVIPSAWVKNYGAVPLTQFDVKMVIGSEYTSTVTAGPLGVGESTLVEFPKWLPSRPGFFAAKCSTLLAGDNYGANDASVTSCVVVNFIETFEATNGGYTADPSSAAWAWGTPASPRPAPRSGTKVWGAPLTGNYLNNANWKLVSAPYIATQDTPIVTFWHWYQFQAPPTPPSAAYDGGNVSFSTDNGTTWVVIEPWAERSAPYHSAPIAGLNNEYGYTGSISAWTQAWFKVPVVNGTKFLLRWRLGSNASTVSYGWVIEDVAGIGMRQPADVGATAIVSPSGTVDLGTVVVPKAKVKNLGGGTRTFEAVFSISNRYQDTKTVTDLLPGEEREITFANWTADTLGTLAVACSTRLAGDDVPANDKTTASVFVRLIDVQPVAIVAPVGLVDSGTVIAPKVRVKNNGNQAATFPTLLVIGSYSNTQTVANLLPGEEREITFSSWTATVRGVNVIKCTTRLSGDRVPSNDKLEGTVTVVIKDVGVTAIVAPAGTVNPGTSVTPACSVYNYGSEAVTYTVRMQIGTFYNQTASVTDHAPGTAAYVTFPNWTASPLGLWAVKCSTELVGDLRPANDKKTGTVAVGRYDAGVEAILVPADSVDSGAVVVPRVRVRNFGPDSAQFVVWFKIHQTADELVSRPVLPGEGEASIGFGWTGGDWFVDQVYEDSVVVSVRGGENVTVNFGKQWVAGPVGNYRLESYSVLLGDVNPGNDTARGVLKVVRAIHDVGTAALVAPVGTLDSGAVVIPRAVVRNYGNRPETFRVRMSIGAAYVDTQEVSLGVGAQDTVEFVQWVARQVGRHTVSCRTLLAGDMNPNNDAKTDSVEVRSVGIGEGSGLPRVFSATGVLPNPAREVCELRLALPEASRVNIAVYDATGRMVREVVDGVMAAGYHRVRIGSGELAEGIYLLKLSAGKHQLTQKFVVQR